MRANPRGNYIKGRVSRPFINSSNRLEQSFVQTRYQAGQIYDNLVVFIHPLISNNAYLVIKNQQVWVIDPGLDGQQISQYLKTHHLTPVGVLVTHGHYDHLAGAGFIQQAFGCQVYLHANDVKLHNQPQNAPYFGTPPMGEWPPIKITPIKTEQDIVNQAWMPVNVFCAPGHTPGSVCYVIDQYLFSGDFVFDVDIGRTDFVYSDDNAMQTSLQRFVKTYQNKALWLMPGHEEWIAFNQLKTHNPYLAPFFK